MPSKVSYDVDVAPSLRALRGASKEISSEMRRLNKVVAEDVIKWTSSEPLTKPQRAAFSRLKASGDRLFGVVRIRNTKAIPFATVAYMGSQKRTGWYGAPWFDDDPPQHLEWVGTANRGMPYAISDAVDSHLDEILERYLDNVKRAFAKEDILD